jgi:2-polyprenyl-3-methyl-5-hydroxy-6-metoxy-1,4-benzoquinol methylase
MKFIQIKTQIFASIRRIICPFDRLVDKIPEHGCHLDLGCGYGIFCSFLSGKKPNVDITGIELDEKKIAIARENYATERIHFFTGDATAIKAAKKYDSITCIDLLHHIPSNNHEDVLQTITSNLKDNGVVIIKDMDKQPFLKYLWNYVHDIVMTRSMHMHYISKQELERLLERNGFTLLEVQDIPNFLYAHYYIACKKSPAQSSEG